MLKSANGVEIVDYVKEGFFPQKVSSVGKKKQYIQQFGCFDIETSNVGQGENTFAIMYIWQFYDGNKVYIGRRWTDFKRLLSELRFAYNLTPSRRYCIYVHNLPFEFQFLRSVVSVSNVFATDVRKVVRFLANEIFEFRCSYRLTNMALGKFCESQQVPVQKLKGFDYEKVRFPDTPLSDFELVYCVNDVIGQHQSITRLMESENDDLLTIPMTSTGYVRREARNRIHDNANKQLIYRTALDEHQYLAAKASTRGGDTHANILYIGRQLSNVYSYDRSSSYPHVMVTGTAFPITKFIQERKTNLRNLKRPPKGLAAIMLVQFNHIRLKEHHYMPYLPYSRAIKVVNPKWNDNGRVICCDAYVIVITEIDFEIINDNYDYEEVIIHEMQVSDAGHLPKSYREYIMELYIRKCELKDGDQYFYDKFKNRLNSTFGMMLTDITREEIIYTNGSWQDAILPDIPSTLARFYNNPKSFLAYQWGTYVTALARKELRRSIDLCGIDTVYVDTDSNKHVHDHSEDFVRLNSEIHEANLSNDIVPRVNVNGKTFEMGIWEDEGKGKALYSKFVTMGAKKYAYLYNTGKHAGEYGVTVAGLNKEKGAKLITAEGLEAFQTGLIFDPTFSGRLTARYDDKIRLEKMSIAGHICEVTSNVALLPTTYELSLEANFAKAVEAVKQGELLSQTN